MSAFYGVPSIIHPASVATLSAFTYFQVYVGTSGGSATVNGMPFILSEASTIEIIINSISDVVGNIYLLGTPINVFQGTPTLSGYIPQQLTMPNPVNGIFTIYAGESYTINGNLTVNGNLIIQAGGTLIITGGVIINTGVVNNSGNIIFN
jgi:adhesin HecA-like repeat protein